jgi:hypothetical protein
MGSVKPKRKIETKVKVTASVPDGAEEGEKPWR